MVIIWRPGHMEFLMKNKSLIFMRETGSNPPVDFLSSKRGPGSSYTVARMIATP